MNRRMRKKRRVGEFAEFGFLVVIKRPPWHTPEDDELLDALIDFAESRNLGLGGTLDLMFVARLACCRRQRCPVHRGRRSHVPVTDDDRHVFTEWLRARGLVAGVGPLLDAWHFTESEYEAATPKVA